MISINLFKLKLPPSSCPVCNSVFWACKQVSGKTTGPIWLNLTSKVSLGMTTHCLGFDYCVAIFVAMVAISNYWQLSFFIKRFH